ncbi:MAG TPA: DsbA family protein [Turneriella sp.]|nr:DsbA family protein [Turneriella sp.]
MQKKAEIIYVYDAYCGWCWGISNTIVRLKNDFQEKFIFSAHPGGLMTGKRIGPIGDFGAYIEKAMPRVTEVTGAIFSEAQKTLIRNRSTVMDSRVPAAAALYIQEVDADVDTIDLAHTLLALNFQTGVDISKPENYVQIFQKFNVDAAAFFSKYNDGFFEEKVGDEFDFVRSTFGAESFPTLVYGQNGSYFPLCQGYQSYENLAPALETLYREPPPL